jgi:hypothetical protein
VLPDLLAGEWLDRVVSVESLRDMHLALMNSLSLGVVYTRGNSQLPWQSLSA